MGRDDSVGPYGPAGAAHWPRAVDVAVALADEANGREVNPHGPAALRAVAYEPVVEADEVCERG